jgi:hypothetical protein
MGMKEVFYMGMVMSGRIDGGCSQPPIARNKILKRLPGNINGLLKQKDVLKLPKIPH